jgi:hypothetical protein
LSSVAPTPPSLLNTSRSRSRVVQAVFSFPVMLASLLAVLATLTVRSRFNDPDMWWQLKTGEFIWNSHTIPTTDIFSFTALHRQWIPHEWLAQVTIFAAYHVGGYSGLMLWLCVFSSAVMIGGYALCTLYSGNAKVSLIGALAIFVFSTVGLSIRPQLLGYTLLLVELIVIHLGRTKNPRWFWALPPLFAIWINCHGSFFLGIGLAGILLLTSFVDFRIGSLVATRWTPRTRNTLFFALVVSAAALFLNPMGWKQIFLPLDFLLHQNLNLSSVQEWQPLQLSSQRGIILLAVLLGILLLVAAGKASLYFDELVLLIVGVWLAGSHERMIFVFGILAAPILSRMLAGSWENYEPATDPIRLNAVMIAAALGIVWLAFPGQQNLAQQASDGNPVKALAFLKANQTSGLKLTGPMLNDYTTGGYLIWAAPEHPVFVDGRAEVYEWAGVLQQFAPWASLQTDPNLMLDKYKIQFCLLAKDSPMIYVLPHMHWKAVYSDDQSIIFVRAS